MKNLILDENTSMIWHTGLKIYLLIMWISLHEGYLKAYVTTDLAGLLWYRIFVAKMVKTMILISWFGKE